jgi:hypothetical protein
MPFLHGAALSRRALAGVGRLEQVAGVRLVTLADGAERRIYAVAMEPMTNRDAGRFDARERGALLFLAPGESREYDLEVGALDGAAEIEAFAARVDTALQRSQRAPATPGVPQREGSGQ